MNSLKHLLLFSEVINNEIYIVYDEFLSKVIKRLDKKLSLADKKPQRYYRTESVKTYFIENIKIGNCNVDFSVNRIVENIRERKIMNRSFVRSWKL
jgi:hypothetical protein